MEQAKLASEIMTTAKQASSLKIAAGEQKILGDMLLELDQWRENQKQMKLLGAQGMKDLEDLVRNKPDGISYPKWYAQNIELALLAQDPKVTKLYQRLRRRSQS